MLINDLSYLESVDANVTGGISVYNSKYDKKYIAEYLSVYKDIDARADVYGNTAYAEGDAVALGYDTTAQSFTATYTDPYTSAASSSSLSATR